MGQCISAAVDNDKDDDLYSYTECRSHLYSNNTDSEGTDPLYSNVCAPLYSNVSAPLSRSSSGISVSGSEQEYECVGSYNLRSEQVLLHPVPDYAPCPHQEAGCQWRGRQRNLENHLSRNISLHLQMMVAHNKRQAEMISALQARIEEATSSKDGTLLWRISNFSQKLLESKQREGLELVSRPFFSSSTGYKLQASLFLNGNGGGENTHLSLYIKLLPGEYDCILKWPFKHTISFTLLDQNMDRAAAVNVMESFIPDQNWPNFSRPSTHNDQDQLGFGFPKFVHQDILSKRGYVKDDTLFIKIRADSKKGVCV